MMSAVLSLKGFHRYTRSEDILSAAIHAVGIVFSIAATAVLVTLSALKDNVWAVVSCSIFGASMITLYSASTWYHAVTSDNMKRTLKKFDHISIYYLIAGTYTPFMLVSLRGVLGWTVFGIIWGLALLGTCLKLFGSNINGAKLWSVGLYLGMGWLIVLAIKPLIAVVPEKGIFFLFLGGLLYSLGVVFYVWKSREYTHAIWHLFVLAGTVMHFFAVLYSCVLV